MSATLSPAFRADASPPAANQAPSASSSSLAAPLIRRAAVLGAGTMGSRIAAHLANAGLPVVLLDIVPAGASDEGSDPKSRSRIATTAIDALLKSKPAAFYEPSLARYLTPGNFEDDLNLLADCDWVIEAVSEDLGIKQTLLAKIAPFLRPGAIVTTNTSGLPVASIAAGMPPRWPALRTPLSSGPPDSSPMPRNR